MTTLVFDFLQRVHAMVSVFCARCGGRGLHENGPAACVACQGSGRWLPETPAPKVFLAVECQRCGGAWAAAMRGTGASREEAIDVLTAAIRAHVKDAHP